MSGVLDRTAAVCQLTMPVRAHVEAIPSTVTAQRQLEDLRRHHQSIDTNAERTRLNNEINTAVRRRSELAVQYAVRHGFSPPHRPSPGRRTAQGMTRAHAGADVLGHARPQARLHDVMAMIVERSKVVIDVAVYEAALQATINEMRLCEQRVREAQQAVENCTLEAQQRWLSGFAFAYGDGTAVLGHSLGSP